MPSSLADAACQKIQAAAVGAQLGSYGGMPAVFVTEAPEDTPDVYVVIDQAAGADATVTKDGKLREVEFDVDLFAPADGTAATIDQIASDLFDLFDRSPISWTGWTGFISAASGPETIDTDPDLQGRTVTVLLTIERNP